jgi:pyridine nucleotide-disulfide oxidoreductase family protein
VTKPCEQKRLVLAGGGHAHVFVLEAFARQPMTGLDLTLITKEPMAAYSGMLPGFVAGHYRERDCLIDLERLSRAAGAKFVVGEVTGIDREKRCVQLADGVSAAYDVVSIDVGITPDTRDIRGATEHALIVKPVSEFAAKWQTFLRRAEAPGGPRHIVVAGGGAAGVELVLGARFRLTAGQTYETRRRDPFTYTIVAGTGVLPGHPARAQRLAKVALADAGVVVIENDGAVAVTPGRMQLFSGREIACDAAIISTKAAAPSWFAATGLARDAAGFLALRPTLQTISDDNIFAAGDCASVILHPRPKAGVFAVRQGPILARQLRRHLEARLLDPFVPQRAFLSLVSLGEKSAIASRGSIAVAGHWAWLAKDWIDRRFMGRFNRL